MSEEKQEQCDSVNPDNKQKCGLPKGHYGRCSSGLARPTWDYKAPPKVAK